MELSNNSYQRQLVGEKKKTVSAQEAIKNLQEEVERLTNKLKVQHTKILHLGMIATLTVIHKCLLHVAQYETLFYCLLFRKKKKN